VEANLKKLELCTTHEVSHRAFVYPHLGLHHARHVENRRKDVLPVLHPALAWIAVALFMVAGIAAGVIRAASSNPRATAAEIFSGQKSAPGTLRSLPA